MAEAFGVDAPTIEVVDCDGTHLVGVKAQQCVMQGSVLYQTAYFQLIGYRAPNGELVAVGKYAARGKTFQQIAEEYRAKHGPLPENYAPSWEGEPV